MSNRGEVYCARCGHEVEPVRPWRGFVWVKRGWYGGLGVLGLVLPVVMSEITLLLPLAMFYALAAGPIHMLAAERHSCSECGAELRAAAK
jgi:hypothetical protein